jgi:hypothetical protein
MEAGEDHVAIARRGRRPNVGCATDEDVVVAVQFEIGRLCFLIRNARGDGKEEARVAIGAEPGIEGAVFADRPGFWGGEAR